ncbi:GrpB family protein [Pseudovibrio sp. Ad37]|uniref:GrpB family protein n=1 Tax=Pseudovibrio sp. Ad37 TaxID=989422 RepID=UPI0007AE46F8|nr:GrpB family protein [Pseudovibrio sp. Ad37]KZL23495.1 dephospho-CoA kinase/protein folding accessory domain-containing protein [Pseudovibrio sp. Ad37]
MQIEMQPPNPIWPYQFTEIRQSLEMYLPESAVIHHIGSTAVPGLVAKNIIDIQITLKSIDDINEEKMASAGFIRGEPVRDHSPPGMTLPLEELAKRFYRQKTPIAANIHVREAGRFNQRYALLCRDYLRAHAEAAVAYGKIKSELAKRFPDDVDAYYDIKDPVFDLIMAGAEIWASATKWRVPLGD